ncbi:ABC transporter permease [Martelella radicis]|uniref:ABC-type dipeptide/oligopeptide/nickel transport system permease subunit n=1 Tax=Martelella radicis TaxID=1397476 RepID=A0A7W6PA59_9HYPH|nr:ABC transporter permease [Martelella radicis]MBB4122066.1 ABC-type dipeptide/oligopeptide/nickel transport system permease subunit [Martelella radicis]
MSAVSHHDTEDDDAGSVVQRGPLELTLRRLARDRASLIAACFIIVLIVFALAAPLVAEITGHTAIEQYRKIGMSPMGLPVGPNHDFWLGADHLGRDVLVRLAYGARISLIVGVVASLAAALIGITIGTTAGFAGGKVDMVLSRIMDLVMSVPFLLCALALVSVFGPSLSLSIGVIVFFSWTTMGRVIRAEVSSLRRREFVAASRLLGAGPFSIVLRDILPNLSVPIIVYTTMMIPTAIVFEATLSFLGLGIVPPTPSWGGMLADASANSIYLVAWWLVVFPGLALLLTTLAFNILGDGLRDALDPKARPVRKSLLKRLKKEARS